MADIDDEIRASLLRLGSEPPTDGVLGQVSGRRDRLVRRRRAVTVVATVAAVAVLGVAIAVARSPRSPEGVVVDSPTTSEPTTTTSTTTTQPTTTTVPPMTVERVRSAVLDPATCEWVVEQGDFARPLTLTDGRLEGSDDRQGFVALFGDPVIGDVDGDGTDDAIFVVHCNAGASGSTFEVQASSGAGAPLGHLAVGEDRSQVQPVAFADGVLTVSYTLHEADEAFCCGGSILATDRFRWDAGQWVLVDRRVVDAGTVGRSIVEAANRGELAALSDIVTPEIAAELQEVAAAGPISGCDRTFRTQEPTPDRTIEEVPRTCVIFNGTGAHWTLVLEPTGVGSWRTSVLDGPAGSM
jgi:hypothetical protein